jgi:hypothetical protein
VKATCTQNMSGVGPRSGPAARGVSRLAGLVLFAAWFHAACEPASAIDIELSYNAAASVEPAADPSGTKLMMLAQYVASVYEDIIEDSHTVSIQLWYEPIGDFNGLFSHLQPANATNRTTQGQVRINPAPAQSPMYFYDPTPADNSEFDMRQWLARDLTPTEQSDRFSGDVPSVFEAGYRGLPLSSAPDEAKNGTDLLTILFHEIGHGLGLNSGLSNLLDETVDGDYDVPSVFVAGNNMAIKVRDIDSEDSRSHPFGGRDGTVSYANMAANPPKVRRLPSATDILSMATNSDWTQIDLPRKDFLGIGISDFNDAGNWLGNRVPNALDAANVRNGGWAQLSATGSAASLLVSDDSIFDTRGDNMTVQTTTTVQRGDFGNATSAILVGDNLGNGKLSSEQIDVDDGGLLLLKSGTVSVRALNVATGGTLSGSGTVHLTGVLVPKLNNNGLIAATGGQTLKLTSTDTLPFDLDGDGTAGRVEAISGSILFDAGLTDDFDGLMRIGASQQVAIGIPWELGPFGHLRLEGSATDSAVLAGATVIVRGQVEVEQRARIDSDAVVKSLANIDVRAGATLRAAGATTFENGDVVLEPGSVFNVDGPTSLLGGSFVVGQNARLGFNGQTTLSGGSYSGAGSIAQNGNLRVTENATIGVDFFDWDGDSGGNSQTTIDAGVVFTINADRIDAAPVTDGFDGQIVVNGGVLVVNTPAPWRLDGVMTLDEVEFFQPVVGGSAIAVVGTIAAPGNATIHSDLLFQPTTFVNANKLLTLNGNLTYQGGGFFGFGAIRQNGDAVVLADTTINVTRYDWDGQFGGATTTVNDQKEFTLDVAHIDDADDIFDGTLHVAGRLTVHNLPNVWTMNGTLHFEGGVIAGAKVINTGIVTGNGTFETDFENNLVLNPGNSPGRVLVDGRYDQGVPGVLNLEIRGSNPVLDHDVLEILGDGSFDGTLNLFFIDGFAPQTGATFDLIRVAGSFSGHFAQTNVHNLQDGFLFTAEFGRDGVYRLVALNDGVYVSEPSAVCLSLVGLVGMFIVVARRSVPAAKTS